MPCRRLRGTRRLARSCFKWGSRPLRRRNGLEGLTRGRTVASAIAAAMPKTFSVIVRYPGLIVSGYVSCQPSYAYSSTNRIILGYNPLQLNQQTGSS